MYPKLFLRTQRDKAILDDPVGYFGNRFDHAGNEREVSPEVYRGSPDLTRGLIDSSGYYCAHSSGSLNFNETLQTLIERRAIDPIIDNFEQLAAPGGDRSRILSLWVTHLTPSKQKTGGTVTELNWTIVRVDLRTGLAIGVGFLPADLQALCAFARWANIEFGLSAPEEQIKQPILPAHRKTPKLNEVLKCLGAELHADVVARTICSGDDLVEALTARGFTDARWGFHQGRHRLSITTPAGFENTGAFSRRIRLRGALIHPEICAEHLELSKGRPLDRSALGKEQARAEWAESLRIFARRGETLDKRRHRNPLPNPTTDDVINMLRQADYHPITTRNEHRRRKRIREMLNRLHDLSRAAHGRLRGIAEWLAAGRAALADVIQRLPSLEPASRHEEEAVDRAIGFLSDAIHRAGPRPQIIVSGTTGACATDVSAGRDRAATGDARVVEDQNGTGDRFRRRNLPSVDAVVRAVKALSRDVKRKLTAEILNKNQIRRSRK